MQYSKNYKIPKPELNDTVNITNIHEIIDKFDTLTKDVDINCSNIKTNEDTRVSNENKRIEAESIRTSSESDRNSNEHLRKADELNRVNKETKRISDEQIRVSNEQNRISAESNRVLKENERLTNEQTRQENETTRTTNESKRVTNESYREETFKRMEEIFDLKAPGDMSKVEYDKDNDGIIDEAKHALEADKATESTHALSSDVSNSVEWNNVQNRPDVAKIEEQLKENTTKTITENTNILSITDNVEGIANITLEGNTIDIAKEPIVSDFKETYNIGKHNHHQSQNLLLNPSSVPITLDDGVRTRITSKDNTCDDVTVTSNSAIPQMLFSFNIISIVENKIGTIPGSNITDKVAWLKKNITKITCNWWGYGKCSNGNKAYVTAFNNKINNYDTYVIVNDSANIKKILYDVGEGVSTYINSNGFAHFMAYTDASDGTTPSTIYTDYINLEVQLNPILKSVGERENNKIEIKSIGKNLFNGVYEKKYTSYGGSDPIDALNETRTAFVKIQPDKTYYIKKHTASNRFILGLYNSTNVESNSLVPLKNLGDNTLEGSITNTVNAKYLSIYVSNANEEPKMQVEEGTTATTYEDYKEDKVTINLKEPLRGVTDNIRDTINTDGTVTRRIGKIVLNGSEDWVKDNTQLDTLDGISFYSKNTIQCNVSSQLICDKFNFTKDISKVGEGISCFSTGFNLKINKSKLSTQDVEGLKKWLSENPTTVYYALKEPIIESIGQPLTLQGFTNGTIQVDTEVTPFIIVKYPSNINSRINTVEDATSSIKDNLGGAWQTLLILADKELKMKSITPLSTSDDISKKINEIIGVW